MNDEDIIKARKKVELLKKDQEYFDKVKSKIQKFKKLDIIKEYDSFKDTVEKRSSNNMDNIKEKIELELYLKRIKELEQLDLIKEYKKYKRIAEAYSKRDFSRDGMINESLSSFAKRTKESNNIMVFMGEELENNEKCFIYRDLETIDTIIISETENDSFKKNNEIISRDLSDKNKVEDEYFNLRKKFFIETYDYGQNVALENVYRGK